MTSWLWRKSQCLIHNRVFAIYYFGQTWEMPGWWQNLFFDPELGFVEGIIWGWGSISPSFNRRSLKKKKSYGFISNNSRIFLLANFIQWAVFTTEQLSLPGSLDFPSFAIPSLSSLSSSEKNCQVSTMWWEVLLTSSNLLINKGLIHAILVLKCNIEYTQVNSFKYSVTNEETEVQSTM